MIQWQTLQTGEVVAVRDGRVLGSSRGLEKEAQSWVAAKGAVNSFVEIHVVGLSSGRHLQILAEKAPTTPIFCWVDPDYFTCDNFEIFQKVLSQLPPTVTVQNLAVNQDERKVPRGPIFIFRGACNSREVDFYNYMRAQNDDLLSVQCQSHDWKFLAESIAHVPSNLAFNIRTLSSLQLPGQSEEARLLAVLRELVT